MYLLYFVVGAGLVWAASWLILRLVKRGLSPRPEQLTIVINCHQWVGQDEYEEEEPLPLNGAFLETLAQIRELPETRGLPGT